jgi:hypothetical protein
MVRSVDDVANKSPAGANEMSLMTYVSEPPTRPFRSRRDFRRAESDSSTRSRTRSAAVVQAARRARVSICVRRCDRVMSKVSASS